MTYIDKNQKYSTYLLATVLHEGKGATEHEELVDKLKYTRDVLFHMINNKKSSKK